MDLKKVSMREIEKELKRRKLEKKKENEWKFCRVMQTEEPIRILSDVKNGINVKSGREVERGYVLEFFIKGREVKCVFRSKNTSWIVGVGYSKCNKEDIFDDYVGSRLAEMRARGDFFNKLAKDFASSR